MVELEYVWSPAEIGERLQQAVELVADINPPPDLRVPLFNLAAQGLMLQVPKQVGAGVAMPGLGVLGGARGH